MKRTKKQARPLFYGWVIVAASVLLSAIGLGMFYSTNSAFVKPVCQTLGFTRAQFSAHRSIVTVCGALLMPLYGRLINRMGAKRVLLAGAVGLSAAMLGYSAVQKLWQLYAVALLNGIFLNGVSFMTIGVLVCHWFDDERGTACGVAYCGSGVGAALAVPAIGRIIESLGWRAAYRTMAAVGLAVLLLTILLLVREEPSEMGLQPYSNGKSGAKGRVVPRNQGMAFGQARHSAIFWMLLIAVFGVSGCVAGPNTHTIPYMTDIGYSTAAATMIVSVFMLMVSVGKILLGVIYDRLGTRAGNLFVGCCCIAFPLMALAARARAAAWGYAVFVGLASAGSSVPLSILTLKYFGERDFSMVFSFVNMASTAGTAAIVPMMGWVYDRTGTYAGAWMLVLAVAITSTALLMLCDRIHRKNEAAETKGASV